MNCSFETHYISQSTNHPLFFLIVTGKIGTYVQQISRVKYIEHTLGVNKTYDSFHCMLNICLKNIVNICLKNILNI